MTHPILHLPGFKSRALAFDQIRRRLAGSHLSKTIPARESSVRCKKLILPHWRAELNHSIIRITFGMPLAYTLRTTFADYTHADSDQRLRVPIPTHAADSSTIHLVSRHFFIQLFFHYVVYTLTSQR